MPKRKRKRVTGDKRSGVKRINERVTEGKGRDARGQSKRCQNGKRKRVTEDRVRDVRGQNKSASEEKGQGCQRM